MEVAKPENIVYMEKKKKKEKKMNPLYIENDNFRHSCI